MPPLKMELRKEAHHPFYWSVKVDPKSILLAFLFHLIFLVIHRAISFINWKAMYIIIFCNWAHAILLVKMSLCLIDSWDFSRPHDMVQWAPSVCYPSHSSVKLRSWLSHRGGICPGCLAFLCFIYVLLSSPFFFHIVPFSLPQTFPSRLPQALDHAVPCGCNLIPSVTLKTHSYVSFSPYSHSQILSGIS